MDTLYNQPKDGRQRAHPTPARQIANLQLPGVSTCVVYVEFREKIRTCVGAMIYLALNQAK